MKPLIERLLTPRKEPAPYPDGWYDVVDPDKREAAEVIQQQRTLLEECERALAVLETETGGGVFMPDGRVRRTITTTLAKLRAQEKAYAF